MTTPLYYLAIDLGAESGRTILGRLEGDRLELSETHRFPNGPIRLPSSPDRYSLRWDILRLWCEIKEGIQRAVRKQGGQLAGIGIDTWGVDYGLLDRTGALLSYPYNYRDSRTDGMLEAAFRRMPRDQIFEFTGIQFMPINTLFQLLSQVVHHAPELEIADTFLTMPDILNFWLSGRKVCEFTNATTTQCYDPRREDWSQPLLEAMGIPRRIFPEIVPPGTVLGPVSQVVAEEVGTRAPVIAPACHDTGSAVAAVPAEGDNFAWISSGTWSIMGTNVDAPVINPQALKYNFTNEGGVGGSFRFSKNVMGLWLVQECRRTWAQAGQEHSYAELTAMAGSASALVSIIDPDYPQFLPPGDMPGRVREFCRRTGQTVPEEKGALVRSVLEGIALKYRLVLERLEMITGRRLETIHIVGGGSQNRLLNQLTADATGCCVVTGPVEATAAGNVLLQAVALGHVDTIQDGLKILQTSFELSTFEPGDRAPWDEAYGRLLDIMEKTQ